MLFKRIVPVTPGSLEAILSYSMIVPISGVVAELGLPLEVQASRGQIIVSFEEDNWPVIEEQKEQFRSALIRRELDVMLVRRIMRIIFGRTVEEP